MEEDERIKDVTVGSRPRWLIVVFSGIALFLAWSALSVSTTVVAPPSPSWDDQNVIGLSIARGSSPFHGGGISESNQNNKGASLDASSSLQSVENSTRTTDACFPFNTPDWLTSERIGNAEGLDVAASFQLLTPPSNQANGSNTPQYQAALEETMCLKGSRFLASDWRNSSTSEEEQEDDVDDKAVRIWTTRLVYLAVTFHQHYQAWEEFNHRRRQTSDIKQQCRDTAWQKYNVSDSDYECPKAKFLVVPLSDSGLGANVRFAAMAALKASLATGRVALYINNFNHSRHESLQKTWTLASCPRRDHQCFFMPSSPCVLTHQDYQNAHLLDKTDTRTLFRTGSFSQNLDNKRVLVYRPTLRPHREPPRMRERLTKICFFLILQGLIPDTPIVQRAIQRLTKPVDETRVAYQGDDELAGGLLLYVTRPQPKYRQQLQMVYEALLGSQKQNDPSIGLPIRASDKCVVESECFPFETYVHAAHDWWLHQWPEAATNDTHKIRVLVTTESTDVIKQKRAWVKREQPPSWQRLDFELTHNSYDVAQDTGYVRDMQAKQTTADNVMFSSVSSLRAQLSHRVVFGNCCSNFHRLLQTLVTNGCSSNWNAEFVCLQDHPDESFRLCCAWERSDRCLQRLGKNTTMTHNDTGS